MTPCSSWYFVLSSRGLGINNRCIFISLFNSISFEKKNVEFNLNVEFLHSISTFFLGVLKSYYSHLSTFQDICIFAQARYFVSNTKFGIILYSSGKYKKYWFVQVHV